MFDKFLKTLAHNKDSDDETPLIVTREIISDVKGGRQLLASLAIMFPEIDCPKDADAFTYRADETATLVRETIKEVDGVIVSLRGLVRLWQMDAAQLREHFDNEL